VQRRGDERSGEAGAAPLGHDADVDEGGRRGTDLSGEADLDDVGRERGDDAAPLEGGERPGAIDGALMPASAVGVEAKAELALDGGDKGRRLAGSKRADLAVRAPEEPQSPSVLPTRRRISKITSSEWLASWP
jgi:hypothetical protein